MFKSEKSGDESGRRSLLSFSRAAETAPPLSSPVDAAQQRHRTARSRREAQSNPLLHALAETPSESHGSAAHAGTAAPPRQERRSASLGDRLRALVGSSEPADAPPVATPRPRPFDDRAPTYPHTVMMRDADAVSGQNWQPLIDPMKIIGGVVDSKLLIVTTTLIGALLGVAIALSTPKKYEAVTELLIDPRNLKLSENNLTEQGLPSDATLAIVENQVRVLTSGTVLSAVVDKLNLEADPEFNGERKSFGVRAIFGELRSILSGTGDADEAASRRRTISIENLGKSLSVERGGKTFVVTVGASTESPEKSALIANTMTDVFLQTYGQIQSSAAGRAADELGSRLTELREDVEQAEQKVAAFKAENDIIDPQGRLITDDEIVKLNEQLSIARARTLELNARASSVRDVDVDRIVGGSIPESIGSSMITELRSQFAAAKQESDRIAVRLGPRHPERQAAEAQLAGAREQIANELRRIGSSVQIELKRAVELEQQLASRLAQLKVRQGDLSGGLVQLRELEREATTARAVYEAYLLRARETGEQRDINTANMSVISTAYPPLDPSGPSRSVIALTGAFLGFASGAGMGMMRGAYRSLRDRRRDALRTEAADTPPSDGWPDGRSGRRHLSNREPSKETFPQSPVEKDTAMHNRYAGFAPAPMPHPAAGYAMPQPGMGYPHQSYPVQQQPVYAQEQAVPYPYAPNPQQQMWPQPAPWPPQAQTYPAPSYGAAPASAYAQPAPFYPSHHGGQAQPMQFASNTQAATNSDSSHAIAEIRASLAELREAFRDYTENRQQRRFR
jgi:uncharacterized protein involved in exopolysaccharide biosynthesis